jgi:hypothetical protein
MEITTEIRNEESPTRSKVLTVTRCIVVLAPTTRIPGGLTTC